MFFPNCLINVEDETERVRPALRMSRILKEGENEMAKIEMADLGVLKKNHANISDIVGIGEKNERNDVMLIQALFKLAGWLEVDARKLFGLNTKDLPEPTGDFDEKTKQALWAFQRKNSNRLLNIDGKVHPASYQNRVIKNAYKGGRVMAITLLNMNADNGVLFLNTGDVSEAVKKISPLIIFT
jgi:hypothetical protein